MFYIYVGYTLNEIFIVITHVDWIRVEATSAPRVFRSQQLDSETIISSFDETYYDSYKLFRQIASLGRTGNSITIASTGCAGAVNFSKFLSCIGLTVQSTVISTAWVSTTTTTTSGFSTIIVGGCTPAFFPYVSCPVWSVWWPKKQTNQCKFWSNVVGLQYIIIIYVVV